MDSSVVRAHQHATNTSRHTGGLAELARTGSLSRPTMAWGAPGQGRARKIRAVVDGCGRPLVVLVGTGRGGASRWSSPLWRLSPSRARVGRPRTGPDVVRADKGYSSRARGGRSLASPTLESSGVLLAREARVRLPDPRQGGPGNGQAQTWARRRARVLFRPRLLRQAQRR